MTALLKETQYPAEPNYARRVDMLRSYVKIERRTGWFTYTPTLSSRRRLLALIERNHIQTHVRSGYGYSYFFAADLQDLKSESWQRARQLQTFMGIDEAEEAAYAEASDKTAAAREQRRADVDHRWQAGLLTRDTLADLGYAIAMGRVVDADPRLPRPCEPEGYRLNTARAVEAAYAEDAERFPARPILAVTPLPSPLETLRQQVAEAEARTLGRGAPLAQYSMKGE